jgi:ATP-dependent Lon protease
MRGADPRETAPRTPASRERRGGMKKKSPSPDPGSELKIPDVLPVLALKETVVFPWVIVPLSVEPEKGVPAVDQALAEGRLIFLVALRDAGQPARGPEDVQAIGSVGSITRMLKMPDGRIRILVQGLARARLLGFAQMEPFLRGRVQRIDGGRLPPSAERALHEEALMRSVRDHLEKAAELGKPLSPEVLMLASSLDLPGRLADLAASNLELPTAKAQELLEEVDPLRRLALVAELLVRELELLEMQQRISSQAQVEIDRTQREYFLRSQLKAIQAELGDSDELAQEIAGFRQLAEERGMSEEGRQELAKQIARLERSHPESGENTIIRTYLDWLTGLPWKQRSEDDLDLENARKVLDGDHFGLEKVKERILEFLAVRRLKADSKGPILCFAGPPGVGKTSLGRSIAKALGRKFIRLSLGGVRDEAEIRGHRRTYVGALPGRIIQGLHQAGTRNPVFMLDEIDKIGTDFRGDPSAALLEVLDPEQNPFFRDHYLGLPYDLSEVIFITTANMLEPIQPAFLDRMEVIRLSGYTEEEKLQIARRHLLPRQLEENGLTPAQLRFTTDGLKKLLTGYTREAGLRHLEREVASICRKTAVKVASRKKGSRAGRSMVVDARRVEQLLGPPKHFSEALLESSRIGVATGLAWTAAGGDLLLIEALAVPGQGKLQLTGSLGEVMKESAQAALSFARHYQARNGEARSGEARSGEARNETPAADFFAKNDIHIHAPAGSIPKDGPSAGITITAAILSVLTGRPLQREIAMTGEITLRGDILPIGGLKEKALAARAAGIRKVIIPKQNERELAELPASLRRDLVFYPLMHMDQVLELTLLP